MIIPEDKIPFDDSQYSDAEDQQSQNDVHSNGLDDSMIELKEEEADVNMLNQAYEASEPSYTLDPDKGIEKEKKS